MCNQEMCSKECAFNFLTAIFVYQLLQIAWSINFKYENVFSEPFSRKKKRKNIKKKKVGVVQFGFPLVTACVIVLEKTSHFHKILQNMLLKLYINHIFWGQYDLTGKLITKDQNIMPFCRSFWTDEGR